MTPDASSNGGASTLDFTRYENQFVIFESNKKIVSDIFTDIKKALNNQVGESTNNLEKISLSIANIKNKNVREIAEQALIDNLSNLQQTQQILKILPKISSPNVVKSIFEKNFSQTDQSNNFSIKDASNLTEILSNPAVQEAYSASETVKKAVKEAVSSNQDILSSIKGPEITVLQAINAKSSNPYREMMGDLCLQSQPSGNTKLTSKEALIIHFMKETEKNQKEPLAAQINAAFPVVLEGKKASSDNIHTRLSDIIQNSIPTISSLSTSFGDAIIEYGAKLPGDTTLPPGLLANSKFKAHCLEKATNSFNSIGLNKEPNPQLINILKCYHSGSETTPNTLQALLENHGAKKIGLSDKDPSLTRVYVDAIIAHQPNKQQNLATLVTTLFKQEPKNVGSINLDSGSGSDAISVTTKEQLPISTLLEKTKDKKCIADLIFDHGNENTQTETATILTTNLAQLAAEKKQATNTASELTIVKSVQQKINNIKQKPTTQEQIDTICQLATTHQKFDKKQIFTTLMENNLLSDAKNFLTSLQLPMIHERDYLKIADEILKKNISEILAKKNPSSSFDDYIKEIKDNQKSITGLFVMHPRSDFRGDPDLFNLTKEYLSVEKRLSEIKMKATDNAQILAKISEEEYRDKFQKEMMQALKNNFTGSSISPPIIQGNTFEFTIPSTPSNNSLASAPNSSAIKAELKPGLPRCIEFNFIGVSDDNKEKATTAVSEAVSQMGFKKIEIEGTIDTPEKLERVKKLLENLSKTYKADQLDLSQLKGGNMPDKSDDPLIKAINSNALNDYLNSLQPTSPKNK